MKYKSYENSAEEFATGLNTELLSAKDNVSARNVNRPITNILENQESNYSLIQTLLKTVYGNANGIVPDVLESFAPEGFEIGSFKNDSENYFVRIPTGMMLLSKLVSEDYTNNNSNPFLKKGDYKYKDNIHKEDFLKDKLHSFVIENKPEINLYERELANLINLDLTDLTNDLKIYQDLIPMTVKVEIVDESGNPRLSANGSPMYVTDSNSKTVYLAKPNMGDLDIYYGNTRATINSLNYSTTYNKVTNGETQNLNDETIKQTVTYRENLQVKTVSNGAYTSDISKALVLKDANGNEKVRTGYYMNVVRATSGDDEVTWLPNKQQFAHLDIFLPDMPLGEETNTDVTVNFYDENNELVETIPFFFSGSLSQQEMNDKFFGEVLYYSKKFNIEKIQANANGNPIIGSRISVKNDNSYYDNYKISISYKTVGEQSASYYRDAITNQSIENLAINKSEVQQYFTNIFDLTNAFLGCFSSYFVNITNIYNYLNLETIIKIANIKQTYALYYDLDGKLENQTNDKYDKTGRFYLTTKADANISSSLIKLFEIEVEPNNVLPNNPVVKSVKSFFDPLDRRLISTKRAELNSLLATTRTELNNYVYIKDADGNREIEITEKFDNGNDEQLRITSPITRIVDVKDTTIHDEPATDSWSDSGNGDTPSDFFEESYEVLDTTKSEDDPNFRKYIYNNNSGKKGIVINKNKGISIFNYDEATVSGNKYSYSKFKPIEICSSKGNINLFNTNNSNGRINIANLKDSNTNIVDVKGKTRIRSANNDQLVIKKIGGIDVDGNDANVVFQIGQSKSKNDTNSLESSNNAQNAVIGELKFTSGTTGTSGDNLVNSNRIFKLGLTSVAGNLKQHIKTIFEARNTKDNSGDSVNNKTVLASHSSIVPKNNKIMLGYPINSRTYKFENNYIPYVVGEDADANILASIKKDGNNNYTGTSTEYVENENRWAAAFINRGYFGRIILSDTASDIKNADTRNGALRLGNSNIFDASSLFINTTRRTINFDNEIRNTSENTIYSKYSGNVVGDGLFFFLNRALGLAINTDINIEPEDGTNYCALGLKTNGAHINKNAYIYRQAFINVNSGENESTTENNSSLVVKGQTVLNGELIIGKEAETIDDTAEHETSTSIIRNSSDKYKKYNEEYFEKDENENLLEKDGYEYLNENKERWLYEFVNFGHSYFDKDITVKGKFTEDTVLNRTLKILNHNYANYDYNEITENCPANDHRYVAASVVDSYSSNSIKLPRNNVSFEVESGLIKFGSNTEKEELDDQSDLELFGSQWIKRRLEINEDGSTLRNTPMVHDGIRGTNDHESPALYVKGASQFSGDIVFGNDIVDFTDPDTSTTYKTIANNKPVSSKPIKAIFWGKNAEATSSGNETNWHSDFDFHGKTWFDYRVIIGRKVSDHLASNSYESSGNNGSLEILGKNATAALKVSGPVQFIDGQESFQQGQSITLEANSKADGTAGGNTSKLVLNKIHEDGGTKTYKDVELSSSGDIEIDSKATLKLSGNTKLELKSSANATLDSTTTIDITSGTNLNATATNGNITLLAKKADKKIIIKNENNGSIELGNDSKTTNISLKTNDGNILASYKDNGSFKVQSKGVDRISAANDTIDISVNASTKISLDSSNSANSITSKAALLSHSVGDTEKIKIDNTSSIFDYDENNILTIQSGEAKLLVKNSKYSSHIIANVSSIELDSTVIKLKDIVEFGETSVNNYATNFKNGNIYAENLNLVGGNLVIRNKDANGGSLTLNSSNFILNKGDTQVKGDASVLNLCGGNTINFNISDTSGANPVISFGTSGSSKIATFDCATTFNGNVNVQSGYLKIGNYSVSIS